MKKIIGLMITITFCSPVIAQIGNQWQKTYGGTDSDWANYIVLTSDGGFIITGFTESFGVGGTDVYLIKTNYYGDTLWTRTYGGLGDDEGQVVRQTNDGGYIIGATTNSFVPGNQLDLYLIKTDSVGNLIWSKTYGNFYLEIPTVIEITADGGYVINIDYQGLMKVDGIGNMIWIRKYGSTFPYVVKSFKATNDGGFILTGIKDTSFSSLERIFLLKTDSIGNPLWSKLYMDTSYNTYGLSLCITNDNGYAIIGQRQDINTIHFINFLKTDSNGNLIWYKQIEAISHPATRGTFIQQTADGGYMLTGFRDNGASNDIHLTKSDSNGTLIWSKIIGTFNGDEITYCCQQTSDQGYITSCTTAGFGDPTGDVYLIKTDSNGTSGCNESNLSAWFTNINTTTVSYPVTVNSVTLTITTPSTITGSSNVTITLLCPILTGIFSSIELYAGFNLFPTPATEQLIIDNGELKIERVEIYDVVGEKIIHYPLSIFNSQLTIDVSALPSGIYFITVTDDAGNRVVRKVVKM